MGFARRVVAPVAILSVVLVAGCGDDDVSVGVGGAEAPTEVTVTCSADTTAVSSAEVAASADGVRVTVVDASGEHLEVRSEVVDGERDLAAGYLGLTDGDHVVAMQPGSHLVLCSASDGPEHMRAPSETEEAVELEVLDPAQLWVPAVLGCQGEMQESRVNDFAAGAAGAPGEPTSVASEYFSDRLRADDAVQQAGYPEAAAQRDGVTVVVLRDGRAVAAAGLHRGTSGWLVGGHTACAEAFSAS